MAAQYRGRARGVEIDRASSADADGLAATFGAARSRAMPWLPVLHSEEEDRLYFAGAIGASDVLVVRREGEPIAFIALRDDMVAHLYVRPEFQRTGIGSALLEAAKSHRPSGLRLWVFQRNEGARAFYARHGFAEVELTDGSANEEREPDVLLSWVPATTTRAAC
jgi:GNAT superfamily N-acetyltransferase